MKFCARTRAVTVTSASEGSLDILDKLPKMVLHPRTWRADTLFSLISRSGTGEHALRLRNFLGQIKP